MNFSSDCIERSVAIHRSSGTRKILLELAARSILMPVMVLTFILGTPGHAVATRRVLHVREEKVDGGGERFRVSVYQAV